MEGLVNKNFFEKLEKFSTVRPCFDGRFRVRITQLLFQYGVSFGKNEISFFESHRWTVIVVSISYVYCTAKLLVFSQAIYNVT